MGEVILFDTPQELHSDQQYNNQMKQAKNSRGVKRSSRDDDDVMSVSSKRTKLTHGEEDNLGMDYGSCAMSVVDDGNIIEDDMGGI